MGGFGMGGMGGGGGIPIPAGVGGGGALVILPAVHPRMGTGFDAAGSAPMLEPPGFMLVNYGRQTMLMMIFAHVIYGAVVGEFSSLAA
jgi:hypothetical protein